MRRHLLARECQHEEELVSFVTVAGGWLLLLLLLLLLLHVLSHTSSRTAIRYSKISVSKPLEISQERAHATHKKQFHYSLCDRQNCEFRAMQNLTDSHHSDVPLGTGLALF